MITIAEGVALGLLSERPWTAYELATRMAAPNMPGFLWPISERTCYRLPRRLVDAGLASARDPADGTPTRYHITDAGKAALAELHPENTPVVTFRSSQLALLYATAGGPTDNSINLLRHIQAGLVATTQLGAATYRNRAVSGPELPGRAHIAALIGKYVSEMAVNAYQWTQTAIQELETLGDGDRAAFATRIWQELADTLDRLLAEMPPAGPLPTD